MTRDADIALIEPGRVFLDKYRIERILGRGGMGVVASARHIHLGTRVAIKFLHAHMQDSASANARFVREARAAALLKSEHVCRVFDVGVVDDGSPYMIMEFIEGQNLRDYHDEHGGLPPEQVVDLVLQACEALAEAHAANIVHRDLKPANLYVARMSDGSTSLKVLDFGISKMDAALGEEITQEHTILGTPAYMPPEQLTSARNADARSDVWSLGVVLYELLERARPFRGHAFSEICVQIATHPVPPMRASLPAGLEQVVSHCLRKQPHERYQNMAELAHALTPYAGTARIADVARERARSLLGIPTIFPRANTAQPAVIATNEASPTSPHGPPGTISVSLGEHRASPVLNTSNRAWVLVVMALTVLMTVGVFLGLGGDQGPDPHPAASPERVPDSRYPTDAAPPDGPADVAPTVAGDRQPTDATPTPAPTRDERTAPAPGRPNTANKARKAARDRRSATNKSRKHRKHRKHRKPTTQPKARDAKHTTQPKARDAKHTTQPKARDAKQTSPPKPNRSDDGWAFDD